MTISGSLTNDKLFVFFFFSGNGHTQATIVTRQAELNRYTCIQINKISNLIWWTLKLLNREWYRLVCLELFREERKREREKNTKTSHRKYNRQKNNICDDGAVCRAFSSAPFSFYRRHFAYGLWRLPFYMYNRIYWYKVGWNVIMKLMRMNNAC